MMDAHESDASVVALARMPGMGPARLRALLARFEPTEAWDRVRAGTLPVEFGDGNRALWSPSQVAAWRQAAAALDRDDYFAAHRAAGIGVALNGSPNYPGVLGADDDPPALVFWRGDLDHLAGARVAVVGTRRVTRYGFDIARSMGADLASSGVAVVSGLARGVDAAAHLGVLDVPGAPPIAVVGSGLDRVYPRENASLWERVADRGVIISEYPLGAAPVAWQFPARNRIIAALADVVVVVESHLTGGAMGTALEATRRGRPVLAVPGPVTSISSAGTNQLLFDGCGPARDADDVLTVLGMEVPVRRSARETRPTPTGDAALVLGQLPWQPVSIEELVEGTGRSLGEVAMAIEELIAAGWVAQRAGWVERLARSTPAGPS